MKEFIYALLRVQGAYRKVFQQKLKEKKINVTFEMFQVMSCLFETEFINQQELANNIFRDKSSISYILKNLEKKGLIERKEDKLDKRNKIINLTDEGTIMKKEIRAILKDIYSQTLKTLDNKMVEECIDQLQQIENAFKENINEK